MLLSLLFVVAIAVDDCDTCKVEINGAGSPTPSPMMKQWAFSYSLLKPQISLDFAPIGGDQAFTAITTPCRKNYQQDFIVSDINFFLIKPGRQAFYGEHGKDLGVFPFFAGALVLPYNLPQIPPESQLVLTRELIWKIYSRKVTTWNDAAFNIEENKSFYSSLPPTPINLVLQTGDVGNTVTMNQLLINIDKERKNNGSQPYGWPAYASVNWGTRFNDGVDNFTHINAKSAFAVVSNVLTIEGTLGYAPLSFVVQAGLRYAKIVNNHSQVVDPANNTNLAAALTYAFEVTSKGNISAIANTIVADNDGFNSYPLTAFYYLVYHKTVDTECPLRREMFKYFNWILTSAAARAQILGSDGYALFDKPFRDAILANLRNTTCQGQYLLEYEFKEDSKTVLRQAAISLSAILLTVAIIILATLSWKRNNRITKAAGLTFATCFLLGCILNYVSVFVWALIPDSDSICQSRYIIVSLGFTLLLGAMFAKCWEISKIFRQARTGDISPLQEVPWWKFCQVFFTVVGINFLLLIILSSYDPPRSKVELTNELELIGVHVCAVEHTNVWLVLQFLYFSALIIWGGYLAYQTRDIWEKYNYPNESRSILLSIYNLIFCGVILIPLGSYLGHDIEVGFFLYAVAIIFPTSFALFMVYGPKIVTFLGSRHSKGGSKGSQAKSRQLSRPGGPASGQKGSDGARETQEPHWGAKAKSQSTERSKQKDEKQSLIVEEDRAEIDDQSAAAAAAGGLSNRSTILTNKETAAGAIAPPTAATAPSFDRRETDGYDSQ